MPEAPLVIVKTDGIVALGERQLQTIAEAGVRLREQTSRSEDALIEAAAAADGLLVLAEPVSARVLASFERCRVVGRLGVGLDTIDLPAATAAGIQITYVPAATTDEVSTHALALLLALSRRIVRFDAAVRGGAWHHLAGGVDMHRLSDQVVGVIGFGRIGAAFARKAGALGPTVLVHDPRVSDDSILAAGFRPVALAELLRRSDYLSLHASLTEETRYLIGAAELALMRPTAQLINVARGPLIDQQALVAALTEGRLAGAALDVLEDEPPATDEPLLALPNVILSPHAAHYSLEAIDEMLQTVVVDVLAVLHGRPPRFPANEPCARRVEPDDAAAVR